MTTGAPFSSCTATLRRPSKAERVSAVEITEKLVVGSLPMLSKKPISEENCAPKSETTPAKVAMPSK